MSKRDIGNPANVDEGHRLGIGDTLCQSLMKDRHKRRALPAIFHVVGTHVSNDINPGLMCKRRTIAQLNGQSRFGPVKNGLAVETDHIDCFSPKTTILQEPVDRIAMANGDLGFEAGHFTGPVRAVHDCLGNFQSTCDALREHRIIRNK